MQAVLDCELPSSTRMLIAVSGGPDSTALLDAVARVAATSHPGWHLRAGHVNHSLRGAESDADEAFVRSLCRELGVEVDVVAVDVRAHASERRISIESAARSLRYAALEGMLSDWHGDILLTGHTADDQAETVLMRLLRGAGLSGLQGVRIRRGQLARPFLSVRRETVLAALQERDLGYRLDSSNLDQRHTRNAVRARLMPALTCFDAHAVDAMARTAGKLQIDAAYLDEETQQVLAMLVLESGAKVIEVDVCLWRSLHPALQSAALRDLIRRLTANASAIDAASIARLTEAIGEVGSGKTRRVELPGAIARITDRRLELRRAEPPRQIGFDAIELPIPGQIDLPAGQLRADEQISRGDIDLASVLTVCGPYHALCDAGALGDSLIVRSRHPGDRIRPLGLHGSRKLHDILIDGHVPVELRDSIAVVQNETHLVWVPGLVLDERVAITATTTRVIHLRFQPKRVANRDRIRRLT